jgi:predicted ATPase/class 3 adenylate cyclase
MDQLPTGTITFLLTDVEGSTRLWEEHPDAAPAALARHDALIQNAVAGHGGTIVRHRGEGDSHFAVFRRASDAAGAACAIQLALVAETWPVPTPLRVRIALHTGEAELRGGDYYGSTVNRCARLRSLAHGGQVLISNSCCELARDALPAGASLRDLGEHHLRDLQRPEHVFQLLHPGLPAAFPPIKSLKSLPHNLPQPLGSFIGREHEVAQVVEMLAPDRTPSTRLVTLTGAGGVGKTRLALQAALELLERFPDGVWWVELAPLADPELLPQAIASALAAREEPGRTLEAALVQYCKQRSLLLVLDNCEHLVQACARMVEMLLRNCPEVRVLATSREALGIAGERAHRVPSLLLPDLDHLPPADRLAQAEAVRLFVDRAAAVRPEFRLASENARVVAQICHRLDGIPLAIELAAARVKLLPLDHIAARLDDRFRLLTGGSRTALPRHQTLRATMDWSYDLLSQAERDLLLRLSVFAGGWTLEAAEAVCSGESIEDSQVFDLLSQLVDKSLVVVDEAGEARYRLLETVRQYGRDRLQESGQGDAWRVRHRERFLTFVEQAEPQLWGAEQTHWLHRLEKDHDNVRAALECSLAQGHLAASAESGLRIASALWRFWEVRGHLSEGRRWLDQALSLAGDAPQALRARALNAAGNLARDQGDYQRAGELYQESLTLRQRAGDRQGVAITLNNLGNLAHGQEQYETARSLYLEALTINRELGYQAGAAINLGNLGNVAYHQADYPQSIGFHEESLALSSASGDRRGMANTLCNLAAALRCQGDPERAVTLYRESLSLHRELGDSRGIAECLEGLAATGEPGQPPEWSAVILGAAQALREAVGSALRGVWHGDYERSVASARRRLSPAEFAAAWAVGRAMPVDRAVSYARGESPGEAP